MQRVYIYRCEHKKGTYLYLPKKDNFDDVPDSLIKLLGDFSFSFDFDLDTDRRLIRTDATEVIKAINEQGYYLQLAPSKYQHEL
ncbi:MAG: YcgL domain-containing protein [Thiotrichaceae bacterium]